MPPTQQRSMYSEVDRRTRSSRHKLSTPSLVALAAGEHKSEEILALNPRGQVPVLVDGEVRFLETTICERATFNTHQIIYHRVMGPEAPGHGCFKDGKALRHTLRRPPAAACLPRCTCAAV